MSSAPVPAEGKDIACSVLLVEDDPAEVALIGEYLSTPAIFRYELRSAPDCAAALAQLRTWTPNVVLLDLTLPDADGPESVRRIHQAAPAVPIVAVTQHESFELSMACINAGAHDYLVKHEIRATLLRRAIGYAITRQREMELRDLRETLVRLSVMSSSGKPGALTGNLVGLDPLKDSDDGAFREIVAAYTQELIGYVRERKPGKPYRLRSRMENVVTRLGDLGAGRRDLIDVHIAALAMTEQQMAGQSSGGAVLDTRIFALEMMGLLVEYWRVGVRRRIVEDQP